MNLLQKMVATVTRIPINLTGDNSALDAHLASRRIAGEQVDTASAVGIAATYANINLLSTTVGATPLALYRTEGETRVVENGHNLSYLLSSSPNATHTPLEVWEFAEAALELDGNFYAEKMLGVQGNPVAFEPLNHELMSVRRDSAGNVRYVWTDAITKRTRNEGADKILHIRTRMSGANSLKGTSTLTACRGSFAMAQATNKSAQGMFSNGVRPSGILSSDLPLTAEQRKETEKLLQDKFVGALNHNRPMLLDNSVKWQQLSLNAQDSQMLESRRFSVEEICLIFGTPPHMIGYTAGNAVSKTLSEQTLGFQKFTMRPRYKRIEMALEKQLLTRTEIEQGLRIRFNLEALLRGATKERSAFYGAGLKDGWLTVNEVRRQEGLPDVPGGDIPRTQMQNVPLTETGNNPNGGDDA